MKSKAALLIAVFLMIAALAGCGSGSGGGYATNSAAPAASASTQFRGETGVMGGFDGGSYEQNDADYDDYDEAPADDEEVWEEDYEPEYDDVIEENVATGGGDEPVAPAGQPRKIIYLVDLMLQTTEFDEAAAQIPAMAEQFGGFVQSSYVEGTNLYEKYYNRTANFTVRIPSENLDAFIQSSGESFHIVSQQKHSSDISGNYYDTKSRLDSLRIQEERLKAMLEGATELQYMLEVERELADVLYQIESMTSELNRMDSSVDYSTVTLYLQEVNIVEDAQPVVKPVTLRERMQETLGDSWMGFLSFCEGIILFLVAMIPFLPVIAIVAILIIVLLRKLRKYLERRREEFAQRAPLTSVPGKNKEPQPPEGE